jgi:hypothetical protein
MKSLVSTCSRTIRALTLSVAVFGAARAVSAQVTPAAPAVRSRPFAPGEHLSYDVRFGAIRVGSGSMEVRGIETVRGRPAYHTIFRVSGGTSFFRVEDQFESWFSTDDLSSLRFYKDLQEGTRERHERYDIFPERATYDEITDKTGEQKSVPNPLDDGSFLYFVRTVPLEPGKTYSFDRYFKPDRNPVTLKVLRRERVTVPAGTFNAIVVQPIIKTPGIFSEGGQAEIWLSDDDRRLMLQMKSKLAFGSLNLYLTEMKGVR